METKPKEAARIEKLWDSKKTREGGAHNENLQGCSSHICEQLPQHMENRKLYFKMLAFVFCFL